MAGLALSARRQLTCLSCHEDEYSLVGGCTGVFWRRRTRFVAGDRSRSKLSPSPTWTPEALGRGADTPANARTKAAESSTRSGRAPPETLVKRECAEFRAGVGVPAAFSTTADPEMDASSCGEWP